MPSAAMPAMSSCPGTPNNINGKCPAALLSDLRGAAAYLALDTVFASKQVKTEALHTFMGHHYYGNIATKCAEYSKKIQWQWGIRQSL